MRETIELREGDSISVVRDRLEQAESRQVALIIPRGRSPLRDELNLTIVRRCAESLALDLVLVTEDRTIARQARLVGLKAVSKVPAAWRVRAQQARPPTPPLPAGDALREAPRTALAPPPYKPMKRGGRGPGRIVRQVIALVTLLACVLAVLVVAAILVPSATVTLDPAGDTASVEAEVLASTAFREVDVAQRQVPARRAQIEVIGEESGQTTGKETQPDKHATGDVVFANKTMEEVTVPKGTVVRTSDGLPVKFYTLLDAKVPGSFGATARVPIMAFEAGPVGNVPALTIRVVDGEPSYKVEVLNDKALQGGNEKRVGIVAAKDGDGLRAALMQKLQQEAYSQLVAHLEGGEWIPPDSLDVAIAEEAFDRKVGEQADLLRLTMKVKVSGVAVAGQGTRDLLTRLLEGRGAKGYMVNDASLKVEQPAGKATVSGETVRFRATASAQLVQAIDLAEAGRNIRGLERAQALERLRSEYAERNPAKIVIQPGWWPRLPYLPSRIRVEMAGGG